MFNDDSDKGEHLKQEALRRQGEEEQQDALRQRSNLNNPNDNKESLEENKQKHRLSLPGKQKDEGPKTEGQIEKEETMKKARANPKPDARGFKAEGDREVYDPVTGRTVWIRDAKLEGAGAGSFLRACLSWANGQRLGVFMSFASAPHRLPKASAV